MWRLLSVQHSTLHFGTHTSLSWGSMSYGGREGPVRALCLCVSVVLLMFSDHLSPCVDAAQTGPCASEFKGCSPVCAFVPEQTGHTKLERCVQIRVAAWVRSFHTFGIIHKTYRKSMSTLAFPTVAQTKQTALVL